MTTISNNNTFICHNENPRLKKSQLADLRQSQAKIAKYGTLESCIALDTPLSITKASLPPLLVPAQSAEQGNFQNDEFLYELEYLSTEGPHKISVAADSQGIVVKIGLQEWKFNGYMPTVESSEGDTFFIQFNTGEKLEIVEFQVSEDKDNRTIKAQVINSSLDSDIHRIHYVSNFTSDLDGNATEEDLTYIIREGFNTPCMVYKRVKGCEEKLIYDQAAQTKMDRSAFSPSTSRIISCNGLAHTILCTMPKSIEPGKKLPTMVYVHGGPFQAYKGDLLSMDYPWAQYFANRGYAFIGINYRGSTSFGADYKNALIKNIAGPHLEDIKLLTEEIAKFDFVDKDRLHYLGHSFGSFTGGLFLAKEPQFVSSNFKTMILVAGIYDWSKNLAGKCKEEECYQPNCSWHGVLDEGTRANRKMRMALLLSKVEGDGAVNSSNLSFIEPADNPEFNSKISPVAYKISPVATRVLVIHGTDDSVTSPNFSQDFAKKLQKANIPTVLTFIENADHQFSTAEPFQQLLKAIKCFIEEQK